MELDLILHCSPTLANVKCANLVNTVISDEMLDQYQQLFQAYGIQIKKLNQYDDKSLLYIYRPCFVLKHLQDVNIQKHLANLDYPNNLEDMLSFLQLRMKENGFPHEIGYFLGYPFADVQGFMCNQPCIFSGYWKVYQNPDETKLLFQRYQKCIDCYLELYEKGCPLKKLLIHRKEQRV